MAESRAPASRVPAPSSAAGVRPGDILADKYRVEQVLGAGGMGIVVAAEHLDLHERVAIKFLLDEAGSDGELSERFLREARAAVKIKSEHVVRVIDVGRLSSGSPYMVMEYLEGEDLAELLQRGPVPIADAVDYVIQACEAMNVAHRAGIVHRDLKPANLFLTHRPDGSPIIKVLDFGISKVKAADGAQLNLTRTQAVMGSPLYMSPEQMKSCKDVDRRTDVWSLGVILHELIAGDVPFSGSVFPEVLLKVMTEAPPRLRSLRPEVPAELEAVVLRCLEKDPEARFPSVAALAVALTPFASERTFSLQARLEHSVSDPPRLGPEPVRQPVILSATRRDAPEPPSQLGAGAAAPQGSPVHQAGTLPSLDSSEPAQRAAQLPGGTHTSWEDSAPTRAEAKRSRWPLRALAIASALCFAAVAAVLLDASPPNPPATAALASEPPATVPPAPPTPAAPVAPPAAPGAAAPGPVAAPIRPVSEAEAALAAKSAESTADDTTDTAHTDPATTATRAAKAPARATASAPARPRRARSTPSSPRPVAHSPAQPTAAPALAPAAAPPPPAPKPAPRPNPLSLEFK